LSAVDVVAFVARENFCFKTSAYDLLDAEYTGLSSRRGSWEAGGSIPSGIDCRISGSRLLSIQARASGKLGLVVRIKHLRRLSALPVYNPGGQVGWHSGGGVHSLVSIPGESSSRGA